MVIAILCFLLSTTLGLNTSPFNYNIYTPSNMCTISYTHIISASSTSATYEVIIPSPPANGSNVIASILKMEFHTKIQISLQVTDAMDTNFTTYLNYDSSLASITIFYMILDVIYYPFTTSEFIYEPSIIPSQTQTIDISETAQHHLSILTTLITIPGASPSGVSIQANSSVQSTTTTVQTTSLIVTCGPNQMAIQKLVMKFIDFDVINFSGDGGSVASKCLIYGTSGILTSLSQINNYMIRYSKSYFVGLQIPYNGQFLLGTLSFDIQNNLNSNIEYFVSQIMIISYRCPSGYPYSDVNKSQCYRECSQELFYDSSQICRPCSINCKTCIENEDKCVTCHGDYTLLYGFKCGCSNSSLLVVQNGNNTCVLCSSYIFGCQQCSSQNQCTKCQNNLYLFDPITCGCQYSNKVILTTNGNSYCVWSNQRQEICQNNEDIKDNKCICTWMSNHRLFNGLCVDL